MQIERRLTDVYGPELTVAYITLNKRASKTNIDPEKDLVFFVKTYAKLSRSSGQQSWDIFFSLINKFLESIPRDVQGHIYEFYQNSAIATNAVTEANYPKVIRTVSKHLENLLKATNLPQLILDFIEKENLPFPDLTGIGSRAHDREDLTFRLPEYRVLTAISLFCKLMCPIWGNFIYLTQPYVKTTSKEAHCLAMFIPALEHPTFADVHAKLENYMRNSVNSFFKRQQNYHGGDTYDLSFTLAHSGFGMDRFAQNVYGMICVKKLTLYDPVPEVQPDATTKPRDVMKYVAVSITATIYTIVTTLQKNSTTMVRRDPSESSLSDTDSTTRLENESLVSKMSADIPLLVAFGVDHIIKRTCSQNNFPMDVFNDAVAYYHKHPPQLTPFSKTMLSSYLGRELGGTTTLRYLTFEPIAKLITLVQMHLASSMVPSQLMHLLSAISTSAPKKGGSTGVDQRIRMVYDSGIEYRKLVSIYPLSLGPNKSIRQQIADLVVFIAEYGHYYNTPPAIMAYMNEAPVDNGTLLKYDDQIVRELCTFLIERSGTEASSADLAGVAV